MSKVELELKQAKTIANILLMEITDLERKGHKGKKSDGEEYESSTLGWVKEMHNVLWASIHKVEPPTS